MHMCVCVCVYVCAYLTIFPHNCAAWSVFLSGAVEHSTRVFMYVHYAVEHSICVSMHVHYAVEHSTRVCMYVDTLLLDIVHVCGCMCTMLFDIVHVCGCMWTMLLDIVHVCGCMQTVLLDNVPSRSRATFGLGCTQVTASTRWVKLFGTERASTTRWRGSCSLSSKWTLMSVLLLWMIDRQRDGGLL